MNPLIAAVTAGAMLYYVATLFAVGAARHKHKVQPPAMTGHPAFERAVRVQANTVEGLVLFLPSLWLFAAYWDVRIAASLGAIWIIGRILYMAGYLSAAAKRGPGFGLQFLASLILLVGGAAGAVLALLRT